MAYTALVNGSTCFHSGVPETTMESSLIPQVPSRYHLVHLVQVGIKRCPPFHSERKYSSSKE